MDLENENEELHNSESNQEETQEVITKVSGMYQDWFLDYAS